jgi:hypothetical protein
MDSMAETGISNIRISDIGNWFSIDTAFQCNLSTLHRTAIFHHDSIRISCLWTASQL